MKKFIPRRIKERNRWLRSDGKPNFKTVIRRAISKLEPLIVKDIATVTLASTILDVCEVMSRYNQRLVPVITTDDELKGVVSGTDILHLLAGEKSDIIRKHNIESIYDFIKLPIRKIMSEELIVVNENVSIDEVISIMILNNIGALPVIDSKSNKVLGIVSEGSIIKHIAKSRTGITVSEVMSREVIVSNYNKTLGPAIEDMCVSGIRRLPIVNEGKIVGVLTWRNIIDLIGRHEVFEMLSSKKLSELLAIPLSKIKLSDPLIVSEDMDIGEVTDRMRMANTDYALVVEEGNLKGIITERDILYGLLAK
ncbi:MAG: hypothetical protein B6U85_05365 [Desulfurococcales archaeon ex4484_42]|nr:MAG: hypothetical protein B6U85_05365 [Desulfurococcales archaeon ex4484_42]